MQSAGTPDVQGAARGGIIRPGHFWVVMEVAEDNAWALVTPVISFPPTEARYYDRFEGKRVVVPLKKDYFADDIPNHNTYIHCVQAAWVPRSSVKFAGFILENDTKLWQAVLSVFSSHWTDKAKSNLNAVANRHFQG